MGGETTNDQARDDMWMSALFYKDMCYNTLSHANACAQKKKGARKYACEVFCSHTPSVAVGCYQL